MPLITGSWTVLTADVLDALDANGQPMHFVKPGSRSTIAAQAAQWGWPLTGVYVSASGGPGGSIPDYTLNQHQVPLVNTPAAPTVVNVGNAGNRSYSYVVVAYDVLQKPLGVQDVKACAPQSPAGATATGNVNLGATNFNRVTWGAVPNADSYDVYRTVDSGNNPATGKTGKIATTTGLTVDDKALVGDGTAVPADATLMVYVQNILDDAVTQLYIDSLEGARSFWVNVHFWNYRTDGLYAPRSWGAGDYAFQVSNDQPGNPPWWQESFYSAKVK